MTNLIIPIQLEKAVFFFWKHKKDSLNNILHSLYYTIHNIWSFFLKVQNNNIYSILCINRYELYRSMKI